MIFKQYDEILSGQKTQTRRIRRPQVQVGRDYAAVPKRGAPAHWFANDRDLFTEKQIVTRIPDPRLYVAEASNNDVDAVSRANALRCMKAIGAVQVRVVIDSIYEERLRLISWQDARAEGVEGVEQYYKLWDQINNRPGIQVKDDPLVWVVKFHLVEPVAKLYQLWQKRITQ